MPKGLDIGHVFPDSEPDATGALHRLSDLQGQTPPAAQPDNVRKPAARRRGAAAKV